VPGKVVAQPMGHANVDTTLNRYTQVLDGSLRDAVDKVAGELFTIVHKQREEVTVSPSTVEWQTSEEQNAAAASARVPTPCTSLLTFAF
jgi:hypothetical protein